MPDATALDERVTTRPADAPGVDPAAASAATSPVPARAAVSVRVASRLRELATFGLVGGIAFVVDVGVYNLLRVTLLDDKPIGAKVISVIVATAVAWLGNRYLTFRADRGRAVLREAVVFGLVNVGGLAIASLCLFVSHYVLGHTSQLADNIAANGVGLVLGTAFRYVAYRWFVFAPATADAR
ncbi:GtrA family protein [Frigoribacterium sp. CFBP 13729]|uniref:GtrA family protein n=1 Tax=Frigoribacterium sp. CFBP 13729 TaxID=2775293 RepID=UPI00177D1B50|nr:GtrA family protein [Frigoribacterium sp. CFBP 13729]MBD8610683.1 GtrA family protein [Frigoribacterium sp. CFBP 13729]